MNKETAVVCLGTAHLITTPGKHSKDGRLIEAEYSRERIDAIKHILIGYGYTVFTDYEPLEPNDYMRDKDWRKERDRELQYRVDFVNKLCEKYGAENVIYVPLHVDAAGDGTKWMNAGGWSAWTTKGTTKSDILAGYLYEAAEKNLPEYSRRMYEGKTQGFYGSTQVPIRMDYSDGDKDKEENYYVLKNTKCVAVLTENMFQDNKADVEWLLSDAGMHAIERLHVEGIMNYIQKS